MYRGKGRYAMEHRGKKAICAVMALLLSMAASSTGARAQTLEELRGTTARLTQTIEAHGRTIALDVQPEFPQADEMGVFVAAYSWRTEGTGATPVYEIPPKRRGIVYRTKPRQDYAPQDLPQGYLGINHPQTAQEALDSAWAMLAPIVKDAPGVTLAWSEMTVLQPHFLYDKEKGEWGEQPVPQEGGAYDMDYDVSLYAAPLLSGTPYVYDWESYIAENAWGDNAPSAHAFASVEAADGEVYVHVNATLPHIEEALAERVDFAPLDPVYERLEALTREGLLREAKSLRLGYMAFVYGERLEEDLSWEEQIFLLKPVWVCDAEIFSNPEDEPFDMGGGDMWSPEETIVFDAQTGEMIERGRVVSYP